jgi:hypothetical protein
VVAAVGWVPVGGVRFVTAIRRWLLDRGSSATHHWSGGNQPAHQSTINRRFMIVPPAMLNGGHAAQFDE